MGVDRELERLEQQAAEQLAGRVLTLENLRDIIYEAFTSERRMKEADRQMISVGMNATESQEGRWKNARLQYHFRMSMLQEALKRYHNQINK